MQQLMTNTAQLKAELLEKGLYSILECDRPRSNANCYVQIIIIGLN
jgi:hypothetical protein